MKYKFTISLIGVFVFVFGLWLTMALHLRKIGTPVIVVGIILIILGLGGKNETN